MSTFTLWNVPQACLWIASRDEEQVARLKGNHTFAELAFENELAWHDIDDPEALPPLPGWIADAQRQLLGACVVEKIKLMGLPSSGGASQQIPSPACAKARFFYNRLEGGECLGPPGTPPGDYWTDLQIVAEDVRGVWPVDRSADAGSSPSIPASAQPAEGDRNRPAGNRPFHDDVLAAEVSASVRTGEFKTPHRAALARKNDIQGYGTEDSKVRRIAEKARKLLRPRG